MNWILLMLLLSGLWLASSKKSWTFESEFVCERRDCSEVTINLSPGEIELPIIHLERTRAYLKEKAYYATDLQEEKYWFHATAYVRNKMFKFWVTNCTHVFHGRSINKNRASVSLLFPVGEEDLSYAAYGVNSLPRSKLNSDDSITLIFSQLHKTLKLSYFVDKATIKYLENPAEYDSYLGQVTSIVATHFKRLNQLL